VIEVLITSSLSDAQLAQLREISPDLRITAMPARKVEEIPNDIWMRTQVLYTDRVLPEPVRAPGLRWVQFTSAGIDFAVQSELLKKTDIMATTISGASAIQAGEYILMMLLTLGHRLPDMAASQGRAEWLRDRWERFMPRELYGATVGLVGYGSIGRQAATLLRPFGATVLAAKRDAMQPQDPGYAVDGLGDPHGDYFQRLYPVQALKSMLKLVDFAVITLPLTPETRGLIGAEELAVMKPTAFIIDISRGGIIQHVPLIEALQEHRLAGAALDVFPEEPLPPNSPLWRMPNVIITPHIAGISPYYGDRALALFAENINRYLVGLPLYNLYDPQKGY
jgi:phosphoglycerate dehydrogenase-like enzyme